MPLLGCTLTTEVTICVDGGGGAAVNVDVVDGGATVVGAVVEVVVGNVGVGVVVGAVVGVVVGGRGVVLVPGREVVSMPADDIVNDQRRSRHNGKKKNYVSKDRSRDNSHAITKDSKKRQRRT